MQTHHIILRGCAHAYIVDERADWKIRTCLQTGSFIKSSQWDVFKRFARATPWKSYVVTVQCNFVIASIKTFERILLFNSTRQNIYNGYYMNFLFNENYSFSKILRLSSKFNNNSKLRVKMLNKMYFQHLRRYSQSSSQEINQRIYNQKEALCR